MYEAMLQINTARIQFFLKKESLIEALKYIKIIRAVQNGDNVNRLNEIENVMCFNIFDIVIDGEEEDLGMFLFRQNLIDLYNEEPAIFKLIVKLEPVINKILNTSSLSIFMRE